MYIFYDCNLAQKKNENVYFLEKRHDHKQKVNGLCIEQLQYNCLQQLPAQFKEFGQKNKDLNQSIVPGLFAEIKFCS